MGNRDGAPLLLIIYFLFDYGVIRGEFFLIIFNPGNRMGIEKSPDQGRFLW